MQTSNWEGADFTNAVVDRVSFDGSSMKVGWENRACCSCSLGFVFQAVGVVGSSVVWSCGRPLRAEERFVLHALYLSRCVCLVR